MKSLTVNQIRDKFLDFFIARKHHLLPSFSLVPDNDKSLLLINSGMAPMKKYFTGQESPPAPRVATCQKCIRTVDIDDVGKDARHGSFFEMLGNFSFGDYFKEEVIPWAWEFLTIEMGIPVDKLYVSVYEEDDEAYTIWKDKIGLPTDRIIKMDKNENFWEHGVGPCGPCSEIHFDRGESAGCGNPACAVGCDCDRFMEVWNLVFTQFDKLEDGGYAPLAFTNIDTGMGLERLAIVVQEAPSIFDIDNIKTIRDKVQELSGHKTLTPAQLVSANIITDHVRSVAFMAADGVKASNEGVGYILRRMLRRAIRHGQALGLKGAFVTTVAQHAIDSYSHAYPNLAEKADYILTQLEQEEKRFLETLDTGMTLLKRHIFTLREKGQNTLSGTDAFKLYDTFGFPHDLTREILEENGLSMDKDGFDMEMENQKTRARAARGVSTYMGADETIYHKLPPGLPTEFCGYSSYDCEGEVLGIIAGDGVADEASTGHVSIVLSKTPFYATSGGQKADIGIITAQGLIIEITDCQQVAGNNIVHIGEIISGTLRIGQKVKATICSIRRIDIMRNHSATHLLQKALREVLGSHVEQQGSEVGPDSLRFDFSHQGPLTPQERDKVEALVNEHILSGAQVNVVETTPDEARAKGAIALFGEKYGDTVRVVSMGDWSVELCGGTHVDNLQAIGSFKLLSESGIAAGVRRIEATTGRRAIALYREASQTLAQGIELCKTNSDGFLDRLQAVLAENKQLKKDIARESSKAAKEQQANIASDLLKAAQTHKGFTLLTAKLDNYDIEALRQLADQLKAEITSGCMLLCGVNPETNAAQFLASATDDAVKSGIHAGNLVKEAAAICGGGGGGRPNHAQAGGKDAKKANQALEAGLAKMKEMLGV
ncbi:MAG: alanine--tRNA ligase [Defluviitaleaceae bacterium]|nr:alanine--tRNA ligase [Defluviitaleaceae bacterium]